MRPETRYARSGDIHIAYQVVGDGPFDLVFVPGFVSNLDHNWEWPALARMLTRLASFSRLIMFDKRGTGLSDRVSGVATLEERMDDVRAVMDAAGIEQATIFGVSEGGVDGGPVRRDLSGAHALARALRRVHPHQRLAHRPRNARGLSHRAPRKMGHRLQRGGLCAIIGQ